LGRQGFGIHHADAVAGDLFVIEYHLTSTVFHSALEFLARSWSHDAGLAPTEKLLRVFFSAVSYPSKEAA
jgi:hypothetical protein